ncbi:hypothetical protein FV228_11665 [Methylobacterium sp. WL18]|nr:hypothetical protein FV228_11665 [Methylobacterium sp. WL18]
MRHHGRFPPRGPRGHGDRRGRGDRPPASQPPGFPPPELSSFGAASAAYPDVEPPGFGRLFCCGSVLAGRVAGPLSRSREGQGEGCELSGETCPLTPTLARTGEAARHGLHELGMSISARARDEA